MTPRTAIFTQLVCQVTGLMLRRQARPLALATLLLLPGCTVPGQLNLGLLGRDISGAAQEARLPPPGLDRPSPNLASVPPIPERPNPATRLAITQGLQAQRDLLVTPLAERREDAPLTEGPAAGQPPIPAGPPARAMLARAPAIPWTAQSVTPAWTAPVQAPVARAPGAPAPGTAAPEAPAPGVIAPEAIVPGEVPALPSADLLGAPPPLPAILSPRR